MICGRPLTRCFLRKGLLRNLISWSFGSSKKAPWHCHSLSYACFWQRWRLTWMHAFQWSFVGTFSRKRLAMETMFFVLIFHGQVHCSRKNMKKNAVSYFWVTPKTFQDASLQIRSAQVTCQRWTRLDDLSTNALLFKTVWYLKLLQWLTKILQWWLFNFQPISC